MFCKIAETLINLVISYIKFFFKFESNVSIVITVFINKLTFIVLLQ